ncbi:MAG: hypothetical protein WBF71_11255 [Microthrixaceae bacterium]
MTNWRRFVPAVIPMILGIYLVAKGSGTRDLVMMLGAFAVVGLVVIGLDFSGPVTKMTAWIVNLLSGILAWIVGLFLVLPIWLWNRVMIGRRLGSASTVGWVETGEPGDKPSRTFSEEVVVHPARPVMSLAAALGVVVILLVGDLGTGIVWNHLTNSGERSVAGAIRIGESEFDTDRAPNGVSPHPPDAREDGTAMSRYPWSHDYFQEFQSVGSAYWPFTLLRPLPFKGRYLNIEGWERLSYQPEGDTSLMPVIAFLGGSAMFGEGQRDQFTIASYVARLAESDGLPVRVRNFGQRGWVMWQEMTLYEQLLAEGKNHFDLSVFYDGANDMTVQTGPVVGVPTHYDVGQYAERLAGGGRVSSAELKSSIFSWWSSRSVVLRAIAKVRGDSAPPAKDSAAVAYKNPNGYGRRGVDVYQRGRHLTQSLSSEYGVVDSYYWQPQNLEAPESDWAAENVGAPTVSLADALDDHLDVYLDNVHTNEEGARLIAEAMWLTLKPKVQAWYGRQDPQPGMSGG